MNVLTDNSCLCLTNLGNSAHLLPFALQFYLTQFYLSPIHLSPLRQFLFIIAQSGSGYGLFAGARLPKAETCPTSKSVVTPGPNKRLQVFQAFQAFKPPSSAGSVKSQGSSLESCFMFTACSLSLSLGQAETKNLSISIRFSNGVVLPLAGLA